MELIVVSGLSGSGKSVALHMLEDLGYYCIDNIPARLLRTMLSELMGSNEQNYSKLAVGVDARNAEADLEALPELLPELESRGVKCDVIFLHAETGVLLRRYRETRRKHPLATDGLSLRDAIHQEREMLNQVNYAADLVIDTTRTSVYELRDTIRNRVGSSKDNSVSVLVESFGFKHGIPSDADFVFDVRCLPNPYWEPPLRPLNGRDRPVQQFLEQSNLAREMTEDIVRFIRNWLPRYIEADRNYLTVAIGCTGGQHRSVYVSEQVYAALAGEIGELLLRHNELPSQPG